MTRAESGDDPTLPATDPGTPGALVGRVLARRYELLAALGAGGMGAVYRARDRELDDLVALKVLRPEIAAMPGIAPRFRREVKLARRVTHPNVARTFELGEDGGIRFLTMELVEGEALSALLRRRVLLPPHEALPILGAMCDALTAAHDAGVVHRDIKPDNVLLARSGRVVVTDFGIAASIAPDALADDASDPGTLVGTALYMAPEQVAGDPVSPATDLYALGIVAFELLTGTLPFEGGTPLALAAARLLHDAPDPRARQPDVPDALAAVILRCLERLPERRFASAAELKAALGTEKNARIPSLSPPDVEASVRPPLLAVLPFVPQGVDAWMGEALADELTDAIAEIRSMRVIARSAIVRHERSDPRALGAEMIVEGSIRGAQISARCVEASGVQRWSARFSLVGGDLSGAAAQIAPAIAQALGRDADSPPSRDVPADPAVLEIYARARRLARSLAVPDVEESVRLFREARGRAPGSAIVEAGYAHALSRLAFSVQGAPPGVLDEAHEAAARAIGRAPDHGEGWLASGIVALHRGDPVLAARSLRAAIARAPSLADAHRQLGQLLLEAGEIAAGARRIEVAAGLDPGLADARWDVVRAAAIDRDWPRMRTLEAELMAYGPRTRWLAHVRVAGWRADRPALEELERDVARLDRQTVFDARMLEALFDAYLRGDPSGVREWTAQVERAPGSSRRRCAFYLQLLVEAEAVLGHGDAARAALERAAEHGLCDIHWLDGCIALDALRAGGTVERVRETVAARAAQIADVLWS